MKTGRPTDRKRPPFGERLYRLRERAGLTQAQVAEHLTISPRAYAFWEREPVSVKPEQINKLAGVLGVDIDELLNTGVKKLRRGGPSGKARQVFESVSRLPRRQQQKIVEVVEALVAQHATGT